MGCWYDEVGGVVLLTIAIPTFNRAAYLGNTLEHLIDQLPFGSDRQIEVLISDNGSGDGTEALCHEYMHRHPLVVRYVRHDKNLGFDRNLDSLFVNARGQYVLLVGDDDYPLPGALNFFWKIINLTAREIPSLVYSYHELVDDVTGMPLDLKEKVFQRPAGMNADLACYKSGVELLRLVGAPLNGGLTGTAFLRSAWLASDRESYIGTNFLQLAVAYQVALRNPVCIVYKPQFVVRMNGDHHWPVNGELYFGLLKAGRPLAQLYPHDIVTQLRRNEDWRVRRAIVSYRGAAPEDLRLTRVILDSLDKTGFGYWLFDLPLLMLPGRIFSLLLNVRLFMGKC